MNPDEIKELLARIRSRGNDPRLAVRPDAVAGAGQELSTEKLTELRAWVQEQREAGISDSDLDMAIRETYRQSLPDIMDPTTGDYQRAALSGASFGFNDELAGAVGAATGQGYKNTRDIVRRNAEGARYAAPKRMLATEVLGGAATAIPAMGASVAATQGGKIAKALATAETGFGAGLASGVGHSESETVPEIIDDAGSSGILGAALGAGGSLLGAAWKGARNLTPTRSVLREVEPILPKDAAQRVARQEAQVPGTAALADQSDEMARFVRFLGQDRDAAIKGVEETARRLRVLDEAKKAVGTKYTPFHGQRFSVTDDLKAAVGGKLKLGEEVDFKTVQDFRSEIGADLRSARKVAKKSRDESVRRQARLEIKQLTPVKRELDRWLQERVEGLAEVDAEFASVMQMLDDATRTMQTAKASQVSHGAARASGNAAASPGASLTRQPTISDVLAKVLSPSRERRAKVLERVLLESKNARRSIDIMRPRESMFSLENPLVSGAAQAPPQLVPSKRKEDR